MPARAMASDQAPATASARAERRVEVAVVVLAFVFHAAFFAWFPSLRSPNELTRVYLASALIEDRSVSIDQQIARNGRIFDVSVREENGERHYYSDKAPGVALLAVPVLALYQAVADVPSLNAKVRLTRLWVSTLPTTLLLVLLLGVLRDRLRTPRLPALLVLAYALGSVATPYASMAYGHQLTAALLFALFVAILKTSPSADAWRSALVGALAALAVMVEYPSALLLLPFGVLFVLRVQLRARALLAAALGAAPFASLLLGYHELAFGSPFKTGYSFIASSFKDVHAQGLLGVAWPRAAHAHLSFLSPAKGLFFFAPWLALALPGLWLLWRAGRYAPHPRDERTTPAARDHAPRFVLALLVLYGLFVSALVYPVGGWTVSQRHLVPAVPFMLLPIGLLIDRLERRPGHGHTLFVGLALPALLACGVSALVWPHYQEHLRNPFWQLGWPLFRDGWVVPSAFDALGVSSRIAGAGLLGLAALALLGDLALGPGSAARRLLSISAALALAGGYLALARLPGRDQDTRADRSFVERVYQSHPSTAVDARDRKRQD
jgi:hypothetical protein